MTKPKSLDDLLGGGVITPENWDDFVLKTKDALEHMIAQGEVPEFLGGRMTGEEAIGYLRGWLDTHQGTLIEGSVDFLAALVRKFAVGEADLPIEEFEAALVSLTDEQLTVLTELAADEIEGAKLAVIDRRRELIADAIQVGKVLLRGALASGLTAILGPAGPAVAGLVGGALDAATGGAPEPAPAAAAPAPEDPAGAPNPATEAHQGPGEGEAAAAAEPASQEGPGAAGSAEGAAAEPAGPGGDETPPAG